MKYIKKKITIGLFIDSYYPMIDGVFMVVDNYAKRLSKYADVIVFAPNYNVKYDDSQFPYKIVRCKSLKLPFIDYSIPLPNNRFKKEIKTYKLDIVHIHSPFVIGKLGIKYAKRNNIPVIGTMHSQFKLDFKRYIKSNKLALLLTRVIIKTFNRCDYCWAVNNEVARIYYEEYKYKKMPEVMNNATDMKPVKNIKEACERINRRHNIVSNEKVLLYVGRINSLKNIFFIVESLKLLKEMETDLQFKMLFVGSGQDEEELKKVIEKNKMQKEVIMCGKVVDRDLLVAYYVRADLFLFPSLYDASSLVQIEASSQKTPCLFIEGSATTATVKDGENGFIAKNNTYEYAKYIAKVMKDKELYEKVKNNCFKDLYKSWDNEVRRVYKKYLTYICIKNML